MPETILLIDGMYVVYSSFFAFPQMQTPNGRPTGAVYGFVTRLESLIREIQAERIVVAFDSKEENFRHRLFPEYKAKRLQPPEALIEQLPLIKEYLELRRIPVIEKPGLEADDLIAILSRSQAGPDREVLIFSADKDLFQLIGPQVSVYHPKLKRRLDREALHQFFGVYPEQIVDYLLLVGDASDNIPGVPGIGDKTAVKIIGQFASLEKLLANPELAEEKLRRKVMEHNGQFPLTRRLLDLRQIPETIVEPKLPPFSDAVSEQLLDFYRRLSFHSLIKNITPDKSAAANQLDISYQIVHSLAELRNMTAKIRSHKSFAFDIETTTVEFWRAEIAGISFVCGQEGYYVPFLCPEKERHSLTLSSQEFKQEMLTIWPDAKIAKTGHNLKFDLLHLSRWGIEVRGLVDDSMIISYLLFPNRRSHGLKELAHEFLNVQVSEYSDLVGRGKSQQRIDEIELEQVSRYCINDSYLAQRLTQTLSPRLAEKQLMPLYRQIELPLSAVLMRMEQAGILADMEYLCKAQQQLKKKIAATAQSIQEMAGYELNLNSSQQLGELLFVKMNLPVSKKTRKTKAFSTDNEVLSELKAFPVVEKILEYRTYKKLLSTYLEGLLECLDEEGRIHTSFNQTVTATGRLSSSYPNLQNIPVGEVGGIHVRRAFIAGQGLSLLAADYSQIELRVIAHFSGDRNLHEAFAKDMDIHQHTADLVFAGQKDTTTQELRRRAKIINFSIIYGSGAFSLAKELGVSVSQAKEFIDHYFATYSEVKKFMERTIAAAEKQPEVQTLAGRIRQIPEVQSANRTVKENGQRMAINTIIQGSAADIIKMAMIAIDRRLTAMKSRLLLQVHDELVFEYPPAEEKELVALVRREMEQVVKLSVPLKVSLKSGPNWDELQPLGGKS